MFAVSSFFQRCSVVKKIPVFSSLNWYRIQVIARSGELIRCKKGDIVSKTGGSPNFVFFLVSGRFQAYVLDSHGRKDDLEFIHRGMFFGIVSALTGQEHSQTFEAMNDSMVFRIPVQLFHDLLEQMPELGLKFSKILSQSIRSRVTKTNLVSKSTIVSVYSPTAGSGGSTYAFNLAESLAKESKDRVIFISIRSTEPVQPQEISDIDEVRPKWQQPPQDLSAIIEDFENIPQLVIKNDFGVDLLNVIFNPRDKLLIQYISDFVSSFIDDYRYIIVDLPSDMDDAVMKTLSQSDLIHLVMGRKRDALESGRTILDRLEDGLKEAFNEERVRVIISGIGTHRGMAEATVKSILDYDVLAFLPHIQKKDLALPVETPAIHFWTLAIHSSYWKAITRVSRQVSGVSIGLVLGGGAAFGLAHIGVLKVLEEEEIPIDMIVGSSMGALIGGLWALGHRSHELEKMAYEFRKKSNLVKLMDFVFPLSGIISGKAVMAWLNSQYGQKTFKDVKIPLRVVAYDLVHRKDVIIQEGLLVDAIRKSISIPGVFEPIVTKNQLIIDGGVMNPLPVNVLMSEGIKKTIAVNVLQSADDVIRGYEETRQELDRALEEPFLKDPWFFIDTRIKFWLNRVFFPNISDIIVRTLEASESLIADQSALQANIVIHPDLSGLNWFELYRADVLIKRGEEAARKQIEKIKDIVKKK